LLVKEPADSQGVSIGVQVLDNKLCSLSFFAAECANHSTWANQTFPYKELPKYKTHWDEILTVKTHNISFKKH